MLSSTSSCSASVFIVEAVNDARFRAEWSEPTQTPLPSTLPSSTLSAQKHLPIPHLFLELLAPGGQLGRQVLDNTLRSRVVQHLLYNAGRSLVVAIRSAIQCWRFNALMNSCGAPKARCNKARLHPLLQGGMQEADASRPPRQGGMLEGDGARSARPVGMREGDRSRPFRHGGMQEGVASHPPRMRHANSPSCTKSS